MITIRINKKAQLSIEFLIILLAIVFIIAAFIPIINKIYDYTTTTFDLANIKNFTTELNTICLLGNGTKINLKLNLNKSWRMNSNGEEISWSSEYTNKTYSAPTSCIEKNIEFKKGKNKILVEKNNGIYLVIENSD